MPLRARISRLSLFALISSLLALCVIRFWNNSYSNGHILIHCGNHYSIRSEAGSISLFGQPKLKLDARAQRLIDSISNDDIVWTITARWTNAGPNIILNEADSTRAADYAKIVALPAAIANRPLLDALADPRRFAAAHVWLTAKNLGTYQIACQKTQDGYVVSKNHLEARVHFSFPHPPHEPPAGDRLAHLEYVTDTILVPFQITCAGSSVQTDLSQLPRIRRQWRDYFAVRRTSLPYLFILLAFLIAPSLWCRRRWRSWRSGRLARRGFCPGCGYDLRASPRRCPECGLEVGMRTEPRATN